MSFKRLRAFLPSVVVIALAAVCTSAAGQVQNNAGSDEARLQAYFTHNDLHPQKTGSGLYYIIKRPGSGLPIRRQQAVLLNYSATLLDGTAFDSNTDPKFGHVEPLKIHAGMKEVVPGFDEGVRLLKNGGAATLFIPSKLGYGAHPDDAGIPANAILVFDIEVTDVK